MDASQKKGIPALALGHRMGSKHQSFDRVFRRHAAEIRERKTRQTLCLGRTLWKLKDQAWGNDKRRQRTAGREYVSESPPCPKRRIHAAADAAQQA